MPPHTPRPHPLVCSSALLTTLLAVTPPIAAQQSTVVPAYSLVLEGNRHAKFGWVLRGNSRYQQVWDRDSIAPNAAALQQVAFRRDTQWNNPQPTWVFQSINVRMSHTSFDSKSMSSLFATNVTGAQTSVFAGNYSLPALAAATTSPAPFDVQFPFQRPFSFANANGNLLLDIQFGTAFGSGGGGWNSTPPWPLDAVSWGNEGFYAVYGEAGTFGSISPAAGLRTASGSTFYQQLQPGGRYDFRINLPIGPSPTLAWIGRSNLRYGSTTLPLDLAALGAPGNRLYVAPDLILPQQTTRWNGTTFPFGWVADYAIAVPAVPSLRGTSIYHQGAAFAPAANQLGLITTAAVSVGLGPSPGAQNTHAIASVLPVGGLGFNVVQRTRGGPVAEFRGTFQ